MKVLLLGASGLLGHNVLRLLLEQGHEVNILVRRGSAVQSADFPNLDRVQRFEGSLLQAADLASAAQGCEAIINCAGTTDMSLLRYEDYLPVNRDLCGLLVQVMRQEGISRLVHTSTVNTIGYGTSQQSADEQAPIASPFAESFYARSKAEGEQILLQAAADHSDWHIVIGCPGFMVGAYDVKPSSGTLLLVGYRKPLMLAPRGGKSFVSVSDVAAALVNALEMGISGCRYLLTGESLSLKEFYRLQASQCGYRQWLMQLPNGILRCAGWLGDVVRGCGVRTQLSSRNVRQLMVREYYTCACADAELAMPHTPISQAIDDFFRWRSAFKNKKY